MSRADQIVDLVAEHPDGVTPRGVAYEFGISSNLVSAYLSRLRRAGRVERPAEGVYVVAPPPEPDPRPAIASPHPMSATVIEARRAFRQEQRRLERQARWNAEMLWSLQRWLELRQ